MADTAAPATAPAESAASSPGAEKTGSTPVPQGDFDVETFLAGGEENTGETKEEEGEDEEQDDGSESESEDEQEGEGEEESESDSEEESDEEEEENEPEDEELLRALKPKAVKRFKALLKQRDEALAAKREAEQARDDYKAKLDKSDEPTPVKVSDDPLAAITTDKQAEDAEAFYKNVRSWCRKNPNGGTPPAELTGGKEVELDADAVASNLEMAEDRLEGLPERRKFLSSFKTETGKAREQYPDMFKEGTAAHKQADGLRKRLLNFRSQPDQEVLIGHLVEALQRKDEEREGVAKWTRVALKKNGKTEAAEKPAPKPKPTVPAKKPEARPAGGSRNQEAWKQLNVPGSSVDVEALLGEG